jgi:hypothetical protein
VVSIERSNSTPLLLRLSPNALTEFWKLCGFRGEGSEMFSHNSAGPSPAQTGDPAELRETLDCVFVKEEVLDGVTVETWSCCKQKCLSFIPKCPNVADGGVIMSVNGESVFG